MNGECLRSRSARFSYCAVRMVCFRISNTGGDTLSERVPSVLSGRRRESVAARRTFPVAQDNESSTKKNSPTRTTGRRTDKADGIVAPLFNRVGPIFYEASDSVDASSGASSSRLTVVISAMLSPSSRRISFTPCALRPRTRTSLTG